MSKWQMVKINDVCSLITDGTHQTPTYSDDGYIFLSSKNVTSGSIDWENVKYVGEELHEKLYKRLAPQLNDILLAKNGTTGVCAKVDKDIVFDIYVSLALLRPKEVINSDYFVFAINNPYTKRKFNSHLKGIGVPNLHLSSIKETKIPLPPLEEQRKIAKNLDLSSELIKLYKAKLGELDKLIQSVFYDMFGDPVTNEKGWEVKNLGEVSKLKAGKNIKANELKNYEDANCYPCFGGNGIRGFLNKYSNDGDFSLIGRQGALCGNVQYASGKFYVTEHAIVVTILNDLISNWLYYVLVYLNLNRLQTGAAQPGLNIEILSNVDIFLPPLPLQQKFADIVIKIEEQKTEVTKALQDAEMLYNSLMQEYFE